MYKTVFNSNCKCKPTFLLAWQKFTLLLKRADSKLYREVAFCVNWVAELTVLLKSSFKLTNACALIQNLSTPLKLDTIGQVLVRLVFCYTCEYFGMELCSIIDCIILLEWLLRSVIIQQQNWHFGWLFLIMNIIKLNNPPEICWRFR